MDINQAREIVFLKCCVPGCWNRRVGGFVECNFHMSKVAVPMTLEQIDQYQEAAGVLAVASQ